MKNLFNGRYALPPIIKVPLVTIGLSAAFVSASNLAYEDEHNMHQSTENFSQQSGYSVPGQSQEIAVSHIRAPK